jgi:glycine oxidase
MSGQKCKGSDVLVVGGGAIGLAAARELAAAGRRVTLVERGRPGEEATRAAGGMLSPLAESSGPGPFLRLGLESLTLWPSFAARLEEETGMDLNLRTDGKLLLALDVPAAERLQRRAKWVSSEGLATQWLEDASLRDREPAAATAVAGLHLEDDGQVDNRTLAQALARAAASAGCVILPGTCAHALMTSSGRVCGIRTEDGSEHPADVVLLAAGAWSGGMSGLPRSLPVRPVKGQMLALALETTVVRTTLETEACYLIPRRRRKGGSVWVGATSEEAGFTRGTTSEGRAALRSAAVQAVPALAHSREVEAWYGFRPGTPDGLPVIGPDPDLRGLIHATGHFRNGILLTPVTTELIVRCVDGIGDPRLGPFGPDRFSGV